jgi:RNA polymerase sigma-70 factor (ECF subfamily)
VRRRASRCTFDANARSHRPQLGKGSLGALPPHALNIRLDIIAGRGTHEPPCAPASSSAAAPALTFERVYDENVDFVWRSARRLGVPGLDVDDVTQRVFLVVHKRLGEFEGRSSLKTWLFSIVLNAVREHHRSARRKSPHWFAEASDPDTVPDAGAPPDHALERAEASRLIDRLLESLDGDKRVVFVMAELEQMTAGEIALATGLDTKAVYSRLRAARIDFERAAARLRRRSEAEGEP